MAEASKPCCAPGESCETSCKCPPGIDCKITKIEDIDIALVKPFSNCLSQDCVRTTEALEEEEIGGSCTCGVGEVCSLTKTEGPDAGKVLLECGHGCKCDISACGTKVAIYKDA
ncbi:unnamed protein product [Amaranthus hypochondriacus]